MTCGVDATINWTNSPGTKPSNSIATCSPTDSAVSANRGCDDCGKLRMTDSAGAGTVVVTAGTVVVVAGAVVVVAGAVVVTAGTVVVVAGAVVVVAGAVGLTEFEATDAALVPIALIATTVKV